MIRAVLDTNVIVSGILSPTGSPGQVLRAALEEQRFEMVTSIAILAEINNVLRRPRIVRRHGWTAGEKTSSWPGFLLSAMWWQVVLPWLSSAKTLRTTCSWRRLWRGQRDT